MTDLNPESVDNQSEDTVDSGAQGAPEANDSKDIVENTDTQPDGQTGSNGDENLGPENLATELESQRKELVGDYHKKLAKLKEEKDRFLAEGAADRKDADILYKLRQDSRFKAYLKQEQARRNGEGTFNVSDEELEAARDSAPAMKALMKRQHKNTLDAAKAEYEAEMQSLRNGLEDMKRERTNDRAFSKFDDLKELRNAGLLDTYIDAGHSVESAYKLYKFDQGEIPSAVRKEADKMISSKKNGAIAKGGSKSGKGDVVIKAKNFNDAIDQFFDQAAQGKKVGRVERS